MSVQMIYAVVSLGFVGAIMAFLIDGWQEKGMILNWYADLLKKLPKNLSKPLGSCVYCFGVWLLLAIGVIFGYSFFEIVFAIGLQNLLLKTFKTYLL